MAVSTATSANWAPKECRSFCARAPRASVVSDRTVIPSAVRMARSLGGRSIIVSQPHTYSRTKALFDDYLTAFDGADIVLVSDIFAAREVDPGDIHSTQLVAALQNCGVNAIYLPGFDELEAWLRANWRENDVVLTLGCGNINLLNERLNA